MWNVGIVLTPARAGASGAEWPWPCHVWHAGPTGPCFPTELSGAGRVGGAPASDAATGMPRIEVGRGALSFQAAPKSLQMVTVAMKLKDGYSLGEKL